MMRKLLPVLMMVFGVFLFGVKQGWSADFQKGVDAYLKKDYATALREWTPLAKQGDAGVQLSLGNLYNEGLGVPKDYKTAVRWSTLAAEQGHPDAKERLKELKVTAEKAQDVALGKLVVVTTKNIFEDMVVYRNPNWDDAWGNKSIHPPATTDGKVRSWSDMNGKMHGRYHEDKDQLQWVGLVCIDWNGNDLDPWKSKQAYRIGFAEEYWLVGEVSPSTSD